MSPSGAAARRDAGALVRTRISEREHRPRSLQGARRWRPRDVIPKHVRHCFNSGCTFWWLYHWLKHDPGSVVRVPYTCRSWRCEHCRRHEAHVLYARIREAMTPLSRDGWTFWVLTCDRRDFKDAGEAFAELSRRTRNLLARLRRFMGRQEWRKLDNEWLATVEAHRSGWPHVNLLLWSPELAHALRDERAEREARGMRDRNATLIGGELLEHVIGAGWGVQSTAEAVLSDEKVASYVVKLAGEGEATAGELAKLSQLPTMAAARFRRLRSGKGFLPPRRKDSRYTGTLVRRTTDQNGCPLVLPLHNVAPEARPQVAAVCYAEEDRWIQEMTNRSVGNFVDRIDLKSRGSPALKGPP